MDLILGSLVKPEELYDFKHVVLLKCRECKDEQQRGTRFCSYCGHHFVPERRGDWKPHIAAWLQAKYQNTNFGPPLFNVEPYSQIDDARIVLGERLASLTQQEDTFEKGPPAETIVIPRDKIDTAFAKVEELFKAFELEQRETSLFFVPEKILGW